MSIFVIAGTITVKLDKCHLYIFVCAEFNLPSLNYRLLINKHIIAANKC